MQFRAQRVSKTHRPAAVPRADLPALLRSREQPPVPRQPAPGRQRADNAEARLRVVLRARPALLGGGLLQEDRQSDRVLHRLQRQHSITSFANAPEATLYGAELERRSTASISSANAAVLLGTAALVLIGNYTYTKSEISSLARRSRGGVRFNRPACHRLLPRRRAAHRPVGPPGQPAARLREPAASVAADAAVSYASERVTSRGAAGLPDIFESPGLRSIS